MWPTLTTGVLRRDLGRLKRIDLVHLLLGEKGPPRVAAVTSKQSLPRLLWSPKRNSTYCTNQPAGNTARLCLTATESVRFNSDSGSAKKVPLIVGGVFDVEADKP